MKTNFIRPGVRRREGYMLFELLVYIGVVFVVLGVGYIAMDRSIRSSIVMRRTADDVARMLSVGETWRADVRAAEQVDWVDAPEGRVLRLQGVPGAGEVAYRYDSGAIYRRTGTAPWSQVMPNVRASTMEPETRGRVLAWKWEVELQPRARHARIRALYTFMAVPANGKRK
jgi:hypothetical protein